MPGYDSSPDYGGPPFSWLRVALACFAIAAIALLLFQCAAGAETRPHREIVGRASVIDGDTFEIRGQRIRFWGVDAPEGRQTCQGGDLTSNRVGRRAADALAGMLGAQTVRCIERDRDRYGRIIAQCYVRNRDIGMDMTRAGWAWDYRQFSGGRYAGAEREARRARRGIWALSCQPPWAWRQSARNR
ncbi:MAG: thermonuclease family protein [Hyphomonadaceae bacterium]